MRNLKITSMNFHLQFVICSRIEECQKIINSKKLFLIAREKNWKKEEWRTADLKPELPEYSIFLIQSDYKVQPSSKCYTGTNGELVLGWIQWYWKNNLAHLSSEGLYSNNIPTAG